MEEGPLFSLPQAEMEGGHEDAPRPRMSLYALSSLPQPVVRGGAKGEVAWSRDSCLANGKCLLHHRYQEEMRLTVRLERNSV